MHAADTSCPCAIRVLDLKAEAAKKRKIPPPPETPTADSPVPLSISQLWYEQPRPSSDDCDASRAEKLG